MELHREIKQIITAQPGIKAAFARENADRGLHLADIICWAVVKNTNHTEETSWNCVYAMYIDPHGDLELTVEDPDFLGCVQLNDDLDSWREQAVQHIHRKKKVPAKD